MSRTKRKKLIQDIEKQRGSKIVAIVTSDRPNLHNPIEADIVSILHDHILAMDSREKMKLDLFIYSRGGDSDVPWTIVSMLREYCREGSLGSLIPYRAHSAATLIALGCDQFMAALPSAGFERIEYDRSWHTKE